ncbi:MAG TPA: aromatic-ring-hydroxylating dioxygenase subunit beta, partial [Geodermatophilus sp.]|nr:aromatic-ring-hydroxylating dioxygenase subunit beta [Geodermatophilus sp.]
MTTTQNPVQTPAEAAPAGGKLITQNAIEQFLYREARYLDDREFEKWLECYADDVVFWMPSWADDDRLTEDPQREMSLIYY